jgi:excisionase family DNA binding protein
MYEELCTVEQAAERLRLHPKTVLRMIRDGRLPATKIGKAYRIQRPDLEALAGAVRAEARQSPDRATCIGDFADLSPEVGMRLASMMTGLAGGREARPDPLRVETAYDPDLRRLKVVIVGAPTDAANMLRAAVGLLEAWR